MPSTCKARSNRRNIAGQQLPTSLDVTCCVRLHTLLQVVGCYCVLLHKVWNQSNFSANNSQHFFCSPDRRSVAQRCWIRLHSSSKIVGATHAHYTWLQRLMSCILPTMHFRSQTCWELLHPFAHHCQHAHNNSQHCCSCCTRLHTNLRPILHLSLIFLLINKSLYDELINKLTETEISGSRTISTLSKQRQKWLVWANKKTHQHQQINFCTW